jgi:ring-1,2-phenylacetyl-CoA epoxidase subunit PaaE
MEQLILKVTNIFWETKDTLSIFFSPADHPQIVYQAGQFITFIFDHDGVDTRRSYSFSSTPQVDDFLSVTIKRIANGEVSRFFADKLLIGQTLKALGPAGLFTINADPALSRQLFLIAAGTGIVPIFSILKKVLHNEPATNLVLITQNHHETDIIFREQLHNLSGQFPEKFKWISLLSKPLDKKIGIHKLNNLILEELIKSNADQHREQLFFICGPTSFMRMAQFTIKLMGYQDHQIRKENFTVDFIPPPPLIADMTPKQITLHYRQKTHHLRSAYPENILQAALNNHIALPYSCRGGRCSSCVAKCIKGKVRMSINEVLTEKDMQNGLVLTCVGYPETDIELEW